MRISWALVKADARAVAPLAAATLAVVLAGGGGRLPPLFVELVWVAGSVSIGAAVVGHELTHGTLGALLTQPVPRHRVLVAKYLVAALGVTAIAAAAIQAGLPRTLVSLVFGDRAVILVAGASLFVAPVATMLTRSALAGATSTIAVPFIVLGLLPRLGIGQDSLAERASAMTWIVGLTCVLSAVAGPWLFRRLEDRGSARAGEGIYLTFSRRATGRSIPGGAPSHLALKELHLHQLPLVVAGMFVAACLVAILAGARLSSDIDPRSAHMVWVYGCVTALLLGAAASAEERQLGTLAAQIVLPYPVWTQFLVKVSVALALCGVLTLALPWLLSSTQVGSGPGRFRPGAAYLLTMPALTVVGLYVSSISPTTVRAFLVAPVLIAGLWIPAAFVLAVSRAFFFEMGAGAARIWWMRLIDSLAVPSFAVFALAVLILAGRNHRLERVPARRVRLQLLGMVACYVLLVALVTGAGAAWYGTRP